MTRISAGVYYPTAQNPLTPLPVLTTRLRTEIVDLTATHTLTQIFCNPILRGLSEAPPINEAKYTFPLYESCAVTAFTAQIGSKLIHGVVKPKEEAKAVYAEAKAAGKQAALLEQNTGEVFTTSVGNIPAGAFVIICIKYVHEIKQDVELEGVRLVIPTIIGPKYGWLSPDSDLYSLNWSANWNSMSPELERACAGRPETAGLAMEIIATMNGTIRGIQSPSHPISVDIGTHSASSSDFSPQKARATLALDSASLTGLDKDFILIVNSTEIGTPRAFLAPHPDLPGTSTLMVTLVPRFTLPQQNPEIVFVVDRSGSMYNIIKTVKSALHVFLASLPIGTFFNICSFGGSHSFLWETSQQYSAETLATAKRHVESMDADLGGTEMLPPIQQTVARRRKGLHTEVLVLTDGEIWDTEGLFSYINTAKADGAVRFFSLGIGESVSHLLVEGISRAGGGYSQLVGTNEKMQKKLIRMLKAALTPHVTDWSVDWEGKAAQLAAYAAQEPAPPAPSAAQAPIVNRVTSLFDTSTPVDDTITSPAPQPLPAVAIPPILQSPSAIPPLFPYTRTTVYFQLTTPPPASITLQGSARTDANALYPLKLDIPITHITSRTTALGLHALLGRKLLQDLEEGRCTYLPDTPALATALRDREGARLGVHFGLASKWTSFVAVDNTNEDNVQPTTPPPPDTLSVRAAASGHYYSSGAQQPAYASMVYKSAANPSFRQTARMTTGGSAQLTSLVSAPAAASPAMHHEESDDDDGGYENMAMGFSAIAREDDDDDDVDYDDDDDVDYDDSPPVSKRSKSARNQFMNVEAEVDEDLVDYSDASDVVRGKGEGEGEDEVDWNGDMVSILSRLQLFSGHFKLSKNLLKGLKLTKEKVEEAKVKLGIAGDEQKENAFATALVLAYLRVKLGESEEEWELMADKAKATLSTDLNEEELKRVEAEAEDLVKGL